MDLIIGSGISGLSYANFTNNEYLIIEADSTPGGYCKTTKRNGFVWDYSGHFFHFQDNSIKDFICKNINKENILNVKKHTQIYYNGKYIDFPFQKNIHQLPKDEFIDCLYDLYKANKQNKESFSFKDMVNNKLGKSISDKFLIPYNEKLYACDLDTLDVDAMGRFFPKASFEEIIDNFKSQDTTSYNSTFTYPKGGAIEYIDALLNDLDKNKISLNESLVKVDIKNKIAYTSKREIQFDNLISTIPFPKLLSICDLEYDKNIFSCNKVLVFNLGFDKQSIDKKNSWIYFPSKDIVFYRLGYYNNIIKSDKMSLYIEIGFNEKEKNPIIDDYLEKTINDLKKLGIVTNHKLVDYEAIMMDPAYVHINKRSIHACESFKKELSKSNIYSIGRYGSWTYCSIEDNIKEAKELISIID